jgi:uncharacterized protein with gpF-like domain
MTDSLIEKLEAMKTGIDSEYQNGWDDGLSHAIAIVRQHQDLLVAEEDVPGLIYFADQLADSIEQLEREPMAWASENLREKQWWHRAKKNVEDYRRMARLVMAALPTLKPGPSPLTETEKQEAVEVMAVAAWNTWNRVMVESGLHKQDNGDYFSPEPAGDDIKIQAHRLLRRSAVEEMQAALSALLEKYELRRRE